MGFRATVRRAAASHAVLGWVRNLTDGSVEARLIGTAGALDSLLAEIGRLRARSITAVDRADAPPFEAQSFDIVATAAPGAAGS